MAPADPFDFAIRVRYGDTDRMGVVYHAKYFEYFEVGRTEWLRARGIAYRDLEERGIGLVVSEASARYLAGARYDDVLTVRTRLAGATRASIDFAYEVLRGDERLVEGTTRLVCVNDAGRPRRLPEELARLLPS
jgi:acyl-CoA thioester hydrolase